MSFMTSWIGRSLTILIVALGFALCIGGSARAQSSTMTVRVQWDPNPPSDGVTLYSLVLDGGAPLSVLPSVCTVSVCEQSVVVALGSHTATVTATNQWGTGPATAVTAVIAPPGPPKNLRIIK
jgi:hypothetical protein